MTNYSNAFKYIVYSVLGTRDIMKFYFRMGVGIILSHLPPLMSGYGGYILVENLNKIFRRTYYYNQLVQ